MVVLLRCAEHHRPPRHNAGSLCRCPATRDQVNLRTPHLRCGAIAPCRSLRGGLHGSHHRTGFGFRGRSSPGLRKGDSMGRSAPRSMQSAVYSVGYWAPARKCQLVKADRIQTVRKRLCVLSRNTTRKYELAWQAFVAVARSIGTEFVSPESPGDAPGATDGQRESLRLGRLLRDHVGGATCRHPRPSGLFGCSHRRTGQKGEGDRQAQGRNRGGAMGAMLHAGSRAANAGQGILRLQEEGPRTAAADASVTILSPTRIAAPTRDPHEVDLQLWPRDALYR